jgi:hypothetical protein
LPNSSSLSDHSSTRPSHAHIPLTQQRPKTNSRRSKPIHPDNTGPLISAAHRRHELTRAKAIRALRELDHAGTPITFQTVARTAGVSRSWLYAQHDLRGEIERLRDATLRAPSPPVSAPPTPPSCND